MYDWHWRIIWLHGEIFVQGASVTLALSFSSIVLGTVGGVVTAFAKGSNDSVFSFLAKSYIELFRALPVLVVIIWIYYVLPTLTGMRFSSFVTACIALSLHLAAFTAETVRAGVASVPQSQYESGIALGMSHMLTVRHVILPQAIRNMLPGLLGLYITEIKNSSFASVIGVNELLHRGNTLISETFRPLEIYTTVAAAYLLLILPLTGLLRRIERRFSLGIDFSSLNHATGHRRS